MCGGCDWIHLPRTHERALRRATFADTWQRHGLPAVALDTLEIVEAGDDGLRDRTDLQLRARDGRVVFAMFAASGRGLVDVGACPALSGPLRDLLEVLRSDPPPLARASLRLRVAPDGSRGVWIDAANEDIRDLLDEGTWLLRALAADLHVEIGQRRKSVVVRDDGRPGLARTPALLPWFTTWLGDVAVPLFLPVGGFSQAGHRVNRLLTRQVAAAVAQVDAGAGLTWVELGAGAGNLTIAALGAGAGRVDVVENDPTALAGLEQTLEAAAGVAGGVGTPDRVRIHRISMHRAAPQLAELLAGAGAVLADPPRSGLGATVDTLLELESASSPTALVYVSCFADTLCADLARLCGAGWQVRTVTGVDQFPGSSHTEWIVVVARGDT